MKWTAEYFDCNGFGCWTIREKAIGQIAELSDRHEHNESYANLLAAAPELLEHLQRVTDQLAVVGDMSHYKDGRIVEEAREVMRKAKGES